MNNIKFSEMSVGGVYKVGALLQAVTEKVAKTNKPYVELEFADGETAVMARKFDCSAEELRAIGVEPEMVVYMTVKADIYNGSTSYTVSDIMENPFPDVSIDDFILRADIDFDSAWDSIIDAVGSSHIACADDEKYEPIQELTLRILNDCKEPFVHSAAGQSIHHNVIGGLLQHTSEMVREAKSTSENYKDLDRELLLCGTALHDIGKFREMSTSPTGHVEYTEEGRLLGHAVIGIEIIEGYAEYGNCNPDRVLLLKHMLAAHHGQLEFGAITEPAIPEAAVLHAIDMIDSRMYIFGDAYKKIEEGTMSGRIYPLGNNTVFRAVKSEPIKSSYGPYPEVESVSSTDADLEEEIWFESGDGDEIW